MDSMLAVDGYRFDFDVYMVCLRRVGGMYCVWLELRTGFNQDQGNVCLIVGSFGDELGRWASCNFSEAGSIATVASILNAQACEEVQNDSGETRRAVEACSADAKTSLCSAHYDEWLRITTAFARFPSNFDFRFFLRFTRPPPILRSYTKPRPFGTWNSRP
jgi:hypothetical protein